MVRLCPFVKIEMLIFFHESNGGSLCPGDPNTKAFDPIKAVYSIGAISNRPWGYWGTVLPTLDNYPELLTVTGFGTVADLSLI